MTETATTDPEAPSVEPEEEEPKVEEVETEFFIAQHADPRRLLPGGQGVYLDDVQRMEAEKIRAKAEDREPDYENAGPVAGTPLYTAGALFPGGLMPKNLKADAVLPVVTGSPPPDDEVKKAKDATLEALEAAQKALEQVQVSARSIPANDSASQSVEPEPGGATVEEQDEEAAAAAEESQAASAALAEATVAEDTAAAQTSSEEPSEESGTTTYTAR